MACAVVDQEAGSDHRFNTASAAEKIYLLSAVMLIRDTIQSVHPLQSFDRGTIILSVSDRYVVHTCVCARVAVGSHATIFYLFLCIYSRLLLFSGCRAVCCTKYTRHIRRTLTQPHNPVLPIRRIAGSRGWSTLPAGAGFVTDSIPAALPSAAARSASSFSRVFAIA